MTKEASRRKFIQTAGIFSITGLAMPSIAGNLVSRGILSEGYSREKITNFASFIWNSETPEGCPFERSEAHSQILFTGKCIVNSRADTWFPSWASDDKLYSPFTDGEEGGANSGSGYNFFPRVKQPVTGFGIVEGSDPLKLKITDVGLIEHEPFPYGGQYPCGSLVYNGIWYYGTYALDYVNHPWDVMGPFIGFNISKDLGKTWEFPTRTALNPLFGESAKDGRTTKMWHMTEKYQNSIYTKSTAGAKVKIGAPHFVDFGKNMVHSPDGKAYMVAHGSTRPNACNSWAAGDQIYLLRVVPDPNTINDPASYEFYGGQDGNGQAVWTRDFNKIKPLLEWNDHMGIVTATYIPPLKKYILCVTDGSGSECTGEGPYDTYFLEAEALTGPWKLISYLKSFGEQAYFVNICSKFVSPDGKKLWVDYSGGWRHLKPNPPGGKYGWVQQEIKILSDQEAEYYKRIKNNE